MKRFVIGILATTALAAAALPAAAQQSQNYGQGYGQGGYGQSYGQGNNGYQYGSGWSRNWASSGRADFRGEFNHIYAGIQHGMNDGSYSRDQARRFFREVQNLRRLEAYYRANDGHVNGREVRDLTQRIERLHAIMHGAHERGHQRRDYRRNGYQDDHRGDRRDDRRDDRHDHDH